MPPRYEYRLWVVLMAIAVHIVEEHALGFPAWTEAAAGVRVTYEDFHLVNAGILVFALASAMIGWRAPAFSLMTPALAIVNAFFHVPASFVAGLYCPGAATSALLFLPAGLWALQGARLDGVLDRRTLAIAFAGGIGWHLFLGVLFAVIPR